MHTFPNVPNEYKENKSSKVISRRDDSRALTGQTVSLLQRWNNYVDDAIYNESFKEVEYALPEDVPLDFIEDLQASEKRSSFLHI